MTKPSTTKPMRVIEETPEYWRVLFDYPPFNIVDADVFQALQDLLVRMETTEPLRASRDSCSPTSALGLAAFEPSSQTPPRLG